MNESLEKLRVWWIPQLPMKAFNVDVSSVEEAAKIMRVLADYDQFQLDNNIKGDYANTGGLQEFDVTDDTDSPNGSWVDWCDDETGIDNPCEYMDHIKSKEAGK